MGKRYHTIHHPNIVDVIAGKDEVCDITGVAVRQSQRCTSSVFDRREARKNTSIRVWNWNLAKRGPENKVTRVGVISW